MVRGVEESPRSCGCLRNCLDKCGCYGLQGEIEQTQQMLQEAQKAHNKAIAKMYKQLRNLLSSNAQSQWDHVCRKMHKCDLWAAVNGQVTEGERPQTWMSFLDCIKLHKLTVFSADAAKRQQFYIQQALRKPQRATM
jgi:hypothetical protein